jgi:ATP-dependent Lon protease
VLLCEQNRKDIEEIRQDYLTGLEFHYVTTMQQVLDFALLQDQMAHPRTFEPVTEEQVK